MIKVWKQEMLEIYGDTLSNKQQQVLKYGPNSLTDSWCLQSLHYKWRNLHKK